jgi:uncharacterized protein YndB with AHSA1/START domain
MAEPTLVSVRLVRRFAVSPERLFDAWLDPGIASRWLFTSPASQANQTDIDARVGGTWRIRDRRGGVDYTGHGEYLEIDRPRRLVFTFGMPQFSPVMNRITVEIAADGAGAVLTLTHEGVPDTDREGLEMGWTDMFGHLDRALTD